MVALLIRHGTSERPDVLGHRDGAGLTEAGRAEIMRMLPMLTQWQVSAIYSSPLERALQTSALIAAPAGMSVRNCPELSEMNFGEWEGKTPRELAAVPAWQRFNSCRGTYGCPGGESMGEVVERVVSFLEKLGLGESPDTVIACITHAEVIRAALCHYRRIPLDDFYRIEVAPASVHVLAMSAPRAPAGLSSPP